MMSFPSANLAEQHASKMPVTLLSDKRVTMDICDARDPADLQNFTCNSSIGHVQHNCCDDNLACMHSVA